ncbi:SusC/RagA family TonB-linked outer membrane protein [Pedobacter sp. AW31-3R]|uniref:SusC/RagA family TonB-linked outer membrane protein n=1 Tax=Pedobacter sp. AW31-3R TaxID=3445781 RepID=UPI003F9FE236
MLSIELKNESAVSAIKKIEAQTSFRFVFRKSEIDEVNKLTLQKGTWSLEKLLSLIFDEARFKVTRLGTNILIATLEKSVVDAAEVRITGMVKDEGGLPLPGVSVILKNNTKYSTATDQNGHFGLSVPESEKHVLVFSYVGFRSKEIALGTETSVSVVLEPSSSSLEEVQVIGYGTTTRRLNTGSVGSITSADIDKQVVNNPLQALAGKIAGMTVVQGSGLPGSSVNIQIRGNNTLGVNGLSGAVPLYIVDGVPFTNFNSSQPINDNLNSTGLIGANGGMSPFSTINANDIERIDILKDADATAIYGARGANGVVLITTKKGKSGKSQVNVNLYKGVGTVGHFIDMMNTEQYLELRKEAYKNDGVAPKVTDAPDLLSWDQNAYTDWQNLLIGGTANVTDAQLNYSGGNDRVRFFTSGNYRKEGTVFPGDMGMERISGRMNLQTTSANNKFNSSFMVNYANDNTNLISADLTSALSLPPNYPLYAADGKLFWGSGFTNPYANLLKTFKNTTGNFIASADLKYTLVKGLNLKANLGYTRTNLSQSLQNPLSSQDPNLTGTSNSARFSNTVTTNYIVEPQAEYSLNVKNSTFTALVGSTFQQNVSDANTVSGSNYAYEALLNTINGAGTVTSTNNYSIYKYASVFGKLNYNLNKKYLLNLTFRRDASSRFGSNYKFADFAAVGAGWIFSDEKLISENFKFLSFGKLRASYGTTGNDQLPNYSYMSLFSVGGSASAYQNIASLALNRLPNPNLKWETTRKMEFGLDLGFLEDKILFKTAAYWHRSSNLLTYANVPLQTGFNSLNENLGALVQNQGLEFELNTTNLSRGDFKWTTAFNISFQTNKLLKFDNIAASFYATSFAIGYPITVNNRYLYTGFDPATGVPAYADTDGNGTITLADRQFLPIGTPYFGGLSNTFSYKNFSLDVFFQFNHRMGVINSVFGSRPGSLNNQNTSVLSRWRNAGDENVAFPAATAVSGPVYQAYNNFGQSDYFYGDASFIKFRSANLSYTLPERWTRSLKLANARIYTQGQNLFTWAKNKNALDPEAATTGGVTLPPLRTIVFGINLTL